MDVVRCVALEDVCETTCDDVTRQMHSDAQIATDLFDLCHRPPRIAQGRGGD